VREGTAVPRFEGVCVAMLRDGLTVHFRAPGRSMLPTIRDGETIVVEPVTAGDVKRGDVVLAIASSRLVAHRVMQVPEEHDGCFLLRGDSLSANDAPVPGNDIVGRVVRSGNQGRFRRVNGRLVGWKIGVRRWAGLCRWLMGRMVNMIRGVITTKKCSSFIERSGDGSCGGRTPPCPNRLKQFQEVQI